MKISKTPSVADCWYTRRSWRLSKRAGCRRFAWQSTTLSSSTSRDVMRDNATRSDGCSESALYKSSALSAIKGAFERGEVAKEDGIEAHVERVKCRSPGMRVDSSSIKTVRYLCHSCARSGVNSHDGVEQLTDNQSMVGLRNGIILSGPSSSMSQKRSRRFGKMGLS